MTYLLFMFYEGRLHVGKGLGFHCLTVIVLRLFQVDHHPWPDLSLQRTILQLLQDLIRVVCFTWDRT